MNVELYNNWYVRTDGIIGAYNVSQEQPNDRQKHNAELIYNALSSYGWSLSAIAGILGNMQHESNLNPAFIQKTNRWRLPNSASSLEDVPNEVMQHFYGEYYTGNSGSRGYGIGLVQWDGKGITRQKFVGYCMNEGYIWYDGDSQMARLYYEYEHDYQFQHKTIYGVAWSWSNYVTNTRTPEESATIWMQCYEISGGLNYRKENARYWYNYFQGEPPEPPTPDDWITGEDFASLAIAYDPDITGVNIPYSQLDCIGFVQKVWRDIDAVSSSDVLCSPLGTNTLWRMNVSPYPSKTFNTTDPNDNNPTNVLWYKETISDCIAEFGGLPAGALLFHQVGDNDPPVIPSQYAGDGIGNFVHVGIYCGNNEVMQSGGRDSSSIPGGGVHRSVYDSSAWNYVAFVVYVDPTQGTPPEPPTPPGPEPYPDLPLIPILCYTAQRKKVYKHVKRKF